MHSRNRTRLYVGGLLYMSLSHYVCTAIDNNIPTNPSRPVLQTGPEMHKEAVRAGSHRADAANIGTEGLSQRGAASREGGSRCPRGDSGRLSTRARHSGHGSGSTRTGSPCAPSPPTYSMSPRKSIHLPVVAVSSAFRTLTAETWKPLWIPPPSHVSIAKSF